MAKGCERNMQTKFWFSAVLALSVIVGSWKGYVALFEPGAQEPKQIFPCPVAALPQQDQQALADGILVRNQRDLEKLLEDYLS